MECELSRVENTMEEVRFLSMEENTLGYYDPNENTICLSLRVMNSCSAQEAMQTALHEFYHFYQNSICALIDDTVGWDSPLATDEYRLWRENQSSYLTAERTGMRGYEAQPIEVSARAFAQEEYQRLTELLARKDFAP